MMKPNKGILKDELKDIFISISVSIAVQITLCSVAAGLIHNNQCKESWISHTTILAFLLISSFTGCGSVIRGSNTGRMKKAALAALSYTLILILTNVIWVGGIFSGVGKGSAVIIAGCMCSAVLFGRNNKEYRHRVKF